MFSNTNNSFIKPNEVELEFIAIATTATTCLSIVCFIVQLVWWRGQIELFISVHTRHDELSGPLPPPAEIILVLTKMFLLMSRKTRVAEHHCPSYEKIK